MSYTPLTPDDAQADPTLSDWRVVRQTLHAEFEAASYEAAAALVASVASAAEFAQHHPDCTVRYPNRLSVALTTHATGGLTTRDAELARTISQLAAAAGAVARPGRPPQQLALAVDTADESRIAPFWAAVLGYQDAGGALVAPDRAGAAVWFQASDEVRTERNRLHLDVYVPAADAPGRVEAALAAGGRLVTDRYAPDWWVLADADGNEVCVCT